MDWQTLLCDDRIRSYKKQSSTDLPMTQVQKKLVSLISDNYKMIYSICARDRDEEERLYLRLLLVTDYICGMTDTFAKDMYQELNGIR